MWTRRICGSLTLEVKLADKKAVDACYGSPSHKASEGQSKMIDIVRTTYTLGIMATLNVRVEEKTKIAAQKTLAKMGLDLSTGVKIFLHQVITEQGLPFTPTKNPVALRAKWDREVAEALKSGKVYKDPRDLFKDLGL